MTSVDLAEQAAPARARTPSLIVVDGSLDSRLLLERELGARGYSTTAYADGMSGLQAVRLGSPDILLLEARLPDINGDEFCSLIRAWSSVPIVMMSERDDVDERILGLRAGADDYVRKPFSTDELAERIAAILRRYTRDQRQLRFEDLMLDVERHRCFRANIEIALTPTEFAILETLARLPERVISRQTLASAVWPESAYIDDRLLDSHVTHLRNKLEADGARRVVQTVRGVGLTLR